MPKSALRRHWADERRGSREVVPAFADAHVQDAAATGAVRGVRARSAACRAPSAPEPRPPRLPSPTRPASKRRSRVPRRSRTPIWDGAPDAFVDAVQALGAGSRRIFRRPRGQCRAGGLRQGTRAGPIFAHSPSTCVKVPRFMAGSRQPATNLRWRDSYISAVPTAGGASPARPRCASSGPRSGR